MAAAKSSKVYKIPVHEDDLSCPICFDELKDPKTLPECAHRVCKICLGNLRMRGQGRYILCPMCRKKSKIPVGGVEQFPTDHLVKKLVENIPGRKEKLALQQAVKDCEDILKAGIEALDFLDKLIINAEKEEIFRAEDVKQQISEHANKLIERIKLQEGQMCSEIDDYSKYCSKVQALRLQERKKTLLQQIKQVEFCASNIRELLKRNCLEDIQELKEFMFTKLNNECKELESKTNLEGLDGDGNIQNIRFDKNTTFSMEHILGSLNKLTGNKVERVDQVHQSTPSFTLELYFEPLSIAISTDHGDVFIGILRSKEKQFDIFDIKGNHLKSVALDSTSTSHLYDVYFSMKEYSLLVLDRGNRQLLNYNLDGRCVKSKVLQDFSIRYISLDQNDRVILTTAYEEDVESNSRTQACYVLVFHQNKDELQLKFGDLYLNNPSGRAVYHNKSYFVPDNYSDLKLFDELGYFLEVFPLNGANPQDNYIYSINVYEDSIIACNTKKKTVEVFSINDFSTISTLDIPSVPWMIEALPSKLHGMSRPRMAIIYEEITRLDVKVY